MKYISAIAALSLLFFSCQSDNSAASTEDNTTTVVTTTNSTADCVKRIIALDEQLGVQRNTATEEQSLSDAIQEYLDGTQQMDYTNCPPNLQPMMEQHLAAWKSVIPVTDKYADRRGKMDALFRELEQGPDSIAIKAFVQSSYNTWVRINAIVNANKE
ncbi:MAG: hypothetical protein AAGK47_00965 [Bacteroidota bacterium]